MVEGETQREANRAMNWDRIEGEWTQLKGSVKQRWGRLTDGDLDVIAGKKDQLMGKLQERYGIDKEEAERQCEKWINSFAEDDRSSRLVPRY
jgi:uncharacterized protein YjbJ (UPF0337 family)